MDVRAGINDGSRISLASSPRCPPCRLRDEAPPATAPRPTTAGCRCWPAVYRGLSGLAPLGASRIELQLRTHPARRPHNGGPQAGGRSRARRGAWNRRRAAPAGPSGDRPASWCEFELCLLRNRSGGLGSPACAIMVSPIESIGSRARAFFSGNQIPNRPESPGARAVPKTDTSVLSGRQQGDDDTSWFTNRPGSETVSSQSATGRRRIAQYSLPAFRVEPDSAD
jgi:hypothetical protein